MIKTSYSHFEVVSVKSHSCPAVVACDCLIHVEPSPSVSVRSYTCPTVVAFRYQILLLEAAMDDVDDAGLLLWGHLIIAWQAKPTGEQISPYVLKSA